MDEFKTAIYEYEQARQIIAKISKQRADLILVCERIAKDHTRNICLVDANNELISILNDNPGDYYAYGEVLGGHFSDPDDEEYCQHCKHSYAIKMGPLAEAKQIFGLTKTKLARLGKELIKLPNATTNQG